MMEVLRKIFKEGKYLFFVFNILLMMIINTDFAVAVCNYGCPSGKTNINNTCSAGKVMDYSTCSTPEAADLEAGCPFIECCSCILKPVCTPDCSCDVDTFVGETCWDGCGGICQGKKEVAPNTGSDNNTGSNTDTSGSTATYSCATRCDGACRRMNSFSSSTSDCSTPVGSVTYITDYSCNFNKNDDKCKCSTCTGSTKGAYENCKITVNDSPTYKGMVIKNSSGNEVAAEAGNKNQICATDFNNSRQVTFVISASDPEDDSLTYSLTWNGHTIMTSNTETIEIPASWNDNGTYPLMVSIKDSYGATTTDSSRFLKIWDCKVPVAGTIFDSTETIPSCSTGAGFDKEADGSILNFKKIIFDNSDSEKEDVESSFSPGSSSYTLTSPNTLTWGNSYNPKFNDDISLTGPKIRVKSSSGIDCPSWTVNTAIVDPYSNDVGLTVDFSGTLIQDPWWQVNGGGVISNSTINGQVPVTCKDNCSLSNNGLISAPSTSNIGKKDAMSWYYSTATGKLANVNNNYGYFYNQYLVRKGVGTTITNIGTGTTITNIDDLGPYSNGVYFINGNLTIDANIELGDKKFLMIIVNGNIEVTKNVNQVDGLLVANNISATGDSDTQLIFNGSLFALDKIDFYRDYNPGVRVKNNTTPTVVVNYDPKLIFNLPGDVAKVLNNWQWGN